MQFRHPELLYALFLLVIPVLVHLFQLRRFRVEKFTNVKFLKKAVLETRKSSRIKKWLILFTRLLLLAAVITAFAQPYLPSLAGEKRFQETVVYLDNSFSMQAKGENGVLLKQGVQQLLETLPQDGVISFFTNSGQFHQINPVSLRKELQEIKYSNNQLAWKTIALKAKGLFTGTDSIRKHFIAISDFQQLKEEDTLAPLPGIQTFLVQRKPQTLNNSAVDSVYISSRSADEISLTVTLRGSGKNPDEISVGVYDDDRLLARKTTVFDENLNSSLVFSLPPGPVEKGRITLEDNGLSFDNDLFFSINVPNAVNVVVIGNSDSDFLSRIFTAPEFDLQVFPEENVDYNLLSQANLVILNEPWSIPFSLKNELTKLHREDVSIVFIPSKEADLQTYNGLFREFDLPVFAELLEQERVITEIAFSHPVFTQVFDEKVQNFQYPSVQHYYITERSSGGSVLNYENGQPFLMEANNIYVFSAPLNTENTNFQSSPLIVPIFYNIGNQTISLSHLYYILGEEHTVSLQTQLDQDEILNLSSSYHSFIPRQRSFQNKVELFLQEMPQQPGHYEVVNDSVVLRTLAFNQGRQENRLIYHSIGSSKDMKLEQNLSDVFEEIKATGEVTELWKWFIIFAVILLLTEMLILKFFK